LLEKGRAYYLVAFVSRPSGRYSHELIITLASIFTSGFDNFERLFFRPLSSDDPSSLDWHKLMLAIEPFLLLIKLKMEIKLILSCVKKVVGGRGGRKEWQRFSLGN
jgi:hypothetical protein